MFRKIFALIASAVMLTGIASAATVVNIGTFPGNDSNQEPGSQIPATFIELGKFDCDNDSCSTASGSGVAIGSFSYAVTSTSGATEGTFTLNPGSGYELAYFVVKAGNEYDLYQIIGPVVSGTFNWDTSNLNGRNLSHLSFYGNLAEVPVPAAALLFPAGLAAMAWRRKKRAA
ncbi:PEP-CTERM sorting domain-containing protein [Parvularcula sp. ZS-1/3]|uniref:PEP-CTERM sorting domain-containing protein n=1 Tax=Parvularcula mediterranea TaxID=2732508 RepID=A0A7Y3RK71_9PROT|nr:PEP-CTERM sorting domain-containing protein [Parvularcula mediterranea]NNU15180.1 PEP-CTERM sorting domain-containing protein [Parvularcula mediterranea]